MRSLRRVVISGATSFIGSAALRLLLERDCEVFGIVRPESKALHLLPDSPRFHRVLCSVGETDRWVSAVRRADTFFHFAWGGPGMAGRADAAVQHQSAVDTLSVLRAAKELGVSRFFFSGSQAEYGKVPGRITEDTPCHPVIEYGKAKLEVFEAAPRLAESLDMEYVHARIFSVYGPGDHPYTLVPSCVRSFLRGDRMELSECTNMWNFMHVRDAAEACVRLAECALPSPFAVVNVAGDDTRVLRDFVEEIHRLCGGSGECAFGARHVSETPVDNWPDTSRLRGLVAMPPPVSFQQGIRELIRLEKEAELSSQKSGVNS